DAATPRTLSSHLLYLDSDGLVGVEVWTRVPPAGVLEGLAAVGFQLHGTSDRYHLAEGLLPIASLAAAAELEGVLSITPAYRPISRAGSVTTEGDDVHHADDVRALDPTFDGTGVKVGVLSDSAGGLARSQDSHDLPEYVERLLHIPGSDEGLAMLEIVYDLAPGADLSFRSIVLGEEDFAQGIRDMAAAGAKVIVDDMILPSEPFFQDGIIAQAVTDVVEEYGVFYCCAAGNEGDLSYEQPFRDDGTGRHDFDDGAVVDTFQTITVPGVDPGYRYDMALSLQWDQPFYTTDGVTSDFDVFVYDGTGTTVVASSESDNIGIRQPLEVVEWESDGTSPTSYTIAIRHNAGPTDVLLKYILIGPDETTIDEYATHSPTVIGHPAAAEAVAVGAVPWDDPDHIEPFSSIGPATIYFDPEGIRLPSPEVRIKPDLVAVDGVTTSLEDFAPFYGTSAAAPHVAGIAAQMWSVNPHLTSNELRQVLTTTSIDLGDPGADPVYGYGRVDALAAQPVAASVPDITSPRVRDISPDEVVGWHVKQIAAWFTEPLDEATAINPANFDLCEAGPDEEFDTGDDLTFTVSPSYDDSTRTVSLTFTAPETELAVGRYRLVLRSDGGITDPAPAANPLNGGTDEEYFFTVAADPPVVEVPRAGSSSEPWAIADDGHVVTAYAYQPVAKRWKWPQVMVADYDPNGHRSAPPRCIPADQTNSYKMSTPDIALDDRGGAVIWGGNQSSGGHDYETFLQLLDSSGRVDGEPINLPSWDSVAGAGLAISEERIAVVLQETDWPVIHVSVLDREGRFIQEPFTVAGDAGGVKIAADSSGDFVVTWGARQHLDYVRGQCFDADGNLLGEPFTVAADAVGFLHNRDVAMAPDGRFIVVWAEDWNDTERSGGLHYRLYDSDGSPVGPARRVAPGRAEQASVDVADDGRFVIAWTGLDEDPWGVYARRYAADGTPQGDIHRVNAAVSGAQGYPTVVMKGDGDFVVSWQDEGVEARLARWCTWDSLLPVSFGPYVVSIEADTSGESVTSMRVSFDHDIDSGTFGPDDMKVRDPVGRPVELRDTPPPITDTGDQRTFEVHFAEPQTIPGPYRLVIGPHIEDTHGLEMNEDGDGANGEEADSYAGSFVLPASLAVADFPFREDFESGSIETLGRYWSFRTEGDGLVDVSDADGPHSGSFHLVMPESGRYTADEAILHVDLIGKSGVTLDFWAKDVRPYPGHATVSISADGVDWHEVSYMIGYDHADWRHHGIDLDAAADAAGIPYTDDFKIRLSNSYNTWYVSAFAWDDIRIMTTGEDVFGPQIVGMSVPQAPLGPVEYFEVTFDEEIRTESFGAEDVTVLGPAGGEVDLRSTDPVQDTGDHRTFRIHFDTAQTALGYYDVAIGPEVLDASVWHNPMNQNGDTIVGGPRDVYEEQFMLPLAGDADGDWDVDREDFRALKEHFGTVSGARLEDGDFDGDGWVGFRDYLVWKAHAGQSVTPPARAPSAEEAVPELPGTVEGGEGEESTAVPTDNTQPIEVERPPAGGATGPSAEMGDARAAAAAIAATSGDGDADALAGVTDATGILRAMPMTADV
ncbi:MAG: S8 family serine peptidase, partial [Phycisphaerae bacterium]